MRSVTLAAWAGRAVALPGYRPSPMRDIEAAPGAMRALFFGTDTWGTLAFVDEAAMGAAMGWPTPPPAKMQTAWLKSVGEKGCG